MTRNTELMRILQLAKFEAADRARQQLHRAGLAFLSLRVETRAAFERALHEFAPEAVIVDAGVMEPGPAKALELARAILPSPPVIVTGIEPQDPATSTLVCAGASACLGRERLPRLARTLQYALDDASREHARHAPAAGAWARLLVQRLQAA